MDANGNALPESTATTWSSSDTQVLAFSEGTAELEALANGTAVLSASIGNFNGTLDVVVAQSPASIVLTPTADTLRAVTESIQLTPTVVDANGFVVASAAGVWSSSAPGIASVSTSGWVSAVGDGIAEIAYTAGGVVGTACITVNLDQVPVTLGVAVGMESLFAEGTRVGGVGPIGHRLQCVGRCFGAFHCPPRDEHDPGDVLRPSAGSRDGRRWLDGLCCDRRPRSSGG